MSCLLSPTDAVFLILYKELYYRHIYAKVSVSNCSIYQSSTEEPTKCVKAFPVFCCKYCFLYNQGGPTLDQRFESYYNYCNLFNYILSKLTGYYVHLPLPVFISVNR